MFKKSCLLVACGLLVAATLSACAPSISDVRVFQVKPPVPYRVLGMVNGGGPNAASAMQAMMQNAADIGANGVIIQGRKTLGSQVLIHAKAISYQGPLPPSAAQSTGAGNPGAGNPTMGGGAPPPPPTQTY